MVYFVSFVAFVALVIGSHELGHLLAARMVGVEARAFSLGTGPLLIESRPDRHGTRWQLRLLPLGGFVDIQPAVLRALSPARRAVVVAAGPAVNLVSGLAILATMSVAHGLPVSAAFGLPLEVLGAIVDGTGQAVAGAAAGDLEAIGGPAMLAQVAGDAVSAGAVPALVALALVHLSVGVTNLVPLPPLDGGLLVLSALEALGLRVPASAELVLGRIGLAFVVALLLAGLFSDLLRFAM